MDFFAKRLVALCAWGVSCFLAACTTLTTGDGESDAATALPEGPPPEALGVVLSANYSDGFVVVRADSWVGELQPYGSRGRQVTVSPDGLITGTLGGVLYAHARIHALKIETGEPVSGDSVFILPEEKPVGDAPDSATRDAATPMP